MKYLKSTKDIPLNLEADNSVCIRWWVDASFAVHPDMKSHSGAMMSMEQGASILGSKKQKLNTKCSTESDLVGVDDYTPMIIWVKYFLETQGYIVANHILSRYQIWFPPNMVPAKAALHVELHIVPRGIIQTKHGTREPHRPSVISGKTTNQLLSLVTQGVLQGLRYIRNKEKKIKY